MQLEGQYLFGRYVTCWSVVLFNDSEQIKEKAEQLYQSCFRYINTLDDLFSAFLIHQTTREHLKRIHKTMTSQTSPDDVKEWAELNRQSKLEFMKSKDDVVKYINGI